MAQARARISPQQDLAQLGSFSGQTAPTSGPGGSASARRASSKRENSCSKPGGARQRSPAKALRGRGARNLAPDRLCSRKGSQGRFQSLGAHRFKARNTRVHQAQRMGLQHRYPTLRHAHPTLEKQRPPGATGLHRRREAHTSAHPAGKEPHNPARSPASGAHGVSTLVPQHRAVLAPLPCGSPEGSTLQVAPQSPGRRRGSAQSSMSQPCWSPLLRHFTGHCPVSHGRSGHSPSCTAWNGLLASMTLME